MTDAHSRRDDNGGEDGAGCLDPLTWSVVALVLGSALIAVAGFVAAAWLVR